MERTANETKYDPAKPDCTRCADTGDDPEHKGPCGACYETYRTPHALRVRHIPSDEPIFVIRARDALFQPTLHAWLSMARHNGVNPDKQARALDDYNAGLKWQQDNAELVRLPD